MTLITKINSISQSIGNIKVDVEDVYIIKFARVNPRKNCGLIRHKVTYIYDSTQNDYVNYSIMCNR